MRARWAELLVTVMAFAACGQDLAHGPSIPGELGDGNGALPAGGSGASGGVPAAGSGGSNAAGSGGSAGACAEYGYADLDGDGYSSRDAGCLDGLSKATKSGFDCDDGDPTVQTLVYLDADADGFGSSAVSFCASATSHDGYVPNLLDCDDGDATIFPGVFDRLGDGIDRDCDGQDGHYDPAQCMLGVVIEFVDVNPDCDSFDVALFDVTSCPTGCTQAHYYTRLANYGSKPVTGPLVVAMGDGDSVLYVDGLAPGQVTEPIALPPTTLPDFAIGVIPQDPGDCDPTNNTSEPGPGSGATCPK